MTAWNTVTDAAWRLATTPSPTPTLNIDPNDVTPGPAGFLIVAVLAVAVFLLIFDMLRRIRRVNYKAEISERLQAELDERDGTTTSDDASGPDDRPGTPRARQRPPTPWRRWSASSSPTPSVAHAGCSRRPSRRSRSR